MHDLGQHLEATVQLGGNFLGVQRLGQLGEPPKVCEQDRHLTPFRRLAAPGQIRPHRSRRRGCAQTTFRLALATGGLGRIQNGLTVGTSHGPILAWLARSGERIACSLPHLKIIPFMRPILQVSKVD